MITKLEQACLPTAVGRTEGGGEKEGKESRAGGGGENKKGRYIILRTFTDLKDTWKSSTCISYSSS